MYYFDSVKGSLGWCLMAWETSAEYNKYFWFFIHTNLKIIINSVLVLFVLPWDSFLGGEIKLKANLWYLYPSGNPIPLFFIFRIGWDFINGSMSLVFFFANKLCKFNFYLFLNLNKNKIDKKLNVVEVIWLSSIIGQIYLLSQIPGTFILIFFLFQKGMRQFNNLIIILVGYKFISR